MAKTLRNQKINQIIYISMGVAIIAIIMFITIFNNLSNKNKDSNNLKLGESSSLENIDTEEANSQVGKSIDEVSDLNELETIIQVENNEQTQETVVNEIDEENKENLDNVEVENTINNQDSDSLVETTNSADETSLQNIEDTEKDPVFTMPVEGEIAKHYGKDKLIYSDTLKEWTTHLGIDIKADKTTVVKASTDGVVKSIKNDPRYGLTIVLEHQNAFTSVYSNLLTAEFVVVGEEVKSGQTLGTVGNSATFEILDEPHLHFEILKDGNSVDPEMYLK